MTKLAKSAGVVIVVTLLLASFGTLPLAAQTSEPDIEMPTTVAPTNDDEVVLILGNGYIQVEDPQHAAGTDPATWTSPQGGWTYVATGDFTGRGADQIIALGGSRAKIYDPFPLGTPVNFDLNIGGAYQFKSALAADIDADGRDELILQRTDIGDIKSRILVYDGNAAGTQWTLLQNLPFGAEWAAMTAGNFIGDAREELALSRESGYDNLLIVLNATTGADIAKAYPGEPFVDLASGDINRDGRDELIGVRNVIEVVGITAPSLVVYQVVGGTTGMEVLASEGFGAPFLNVTAGDLDNDGADEIGMFRNLDPPYAGLLAMDYANPLVSLNEVIGRGWTDIQAGDINGDGKQEVLILKGNLVRAYGVSPVSILWSKSGSYKGIFATGNIDGSGIVAVPRLSVAPTSLSFEMDYGGSVTAKQVNVTNSTTDEVINWTATVNPAVDWLTLSKTSGTTPGSFMVGINTQAAPLGSSSAQVVVSAGAGVEGSPVTVDVSLTVRAPALQVSPNAFEAEARPGQALPSRTLRVTEAGGGVGNIGWYACILEKAQWEALKARADEVQDVRVTPDGIDAILDGEPIHIQSVSWLSISPTQGTTPSNIQVSFNTNQPLGLYHATIIVDGGAGVINRLGYADVTLLVAEPMSYMPRVVKQ